MTGRITERVESSPGIEAAATISTLPLEHGLMSSFDVEGRPKPGATEPQGRAQWRLISPAYFRAMRVAVRDGIASGVDDATLQRAAVAAGAATRTVDYGVRARQDRDNARRVVIEERAGA